MPIALADAIPYGQPPVDYLGPAADDPAAALARRLASGEAALEWKEPGGYLRSLLAALDVPADSQLLVFSKTALNPALVTPKNPRAVYFNDDVCVGWVPGADAIEITAIDPVKGPLFYVLPQDRAARPDLKRENRCLACHVGNTTLQVPGLVVRSFLTDETGKPLAGYSRITHDTPFDQRGGGWYVTGTHGGQPHCGNLFGANVTQRYRDEPLAAGNRTDLSSSIDVAKYLTPHSDLVAHLVLQHQAHGLNLIVRAGMEDRLGRRSDVEEQLVRYLLFADEPPLKSPVKGTSAFAEGFANRGRADARGRSLRTLNLKTRLFEHRLSYLVDSRAFHGLPPEARGRIRARLEALLAAPDEPPDLRRPPAEERAAILDLLRAM